MAQETCWTLIETAASGDAAARTEFAERYLPVVRAYLEARWRDRLSTEELEDALQEVFVECLREEGVLARLADGRRQDFHGYLFGVVRNIALRVETARKRKLDAPQPESFHPDEVARDESSLSRVFDRAWAESLIREAGEKLGRNACEAGERAARRVELLRLLFQEQLAIPEIALRWEVAPDFLHHEYATARSEFRRALEEVIAFHRPDDPHVAVERECREMLSLLG